MGLAIMVKVGKMSSNWKQLLASDVIHDPIQVNRPKKRKRSEAEKAVDEAKKKKKPYPGGGDAPPTAGKTSEVLTDVLAIDCEMVGVGDGGPTNALARVSIVNSEGECVYDTFVKCREKVTDFRT